MKYCIKGASRRGCKREGAAEGGNRMQGEVWRRCTTTNQMEINTYMKFNASQDSRCLLPGSLRVVLMPLSAPPPLQLHHAGPNMAEAAAAPAAAALAVVKNVAK